MKRIIFALISVILLMITGCSTTVYQIEPKDEFEYYDGRKIITLESDSLFMSVNFEDYTGREARFFIFADNQGDKQFLISPENISITILSDKDPRYDKKTFPTANPERRLRYLKESESELDAEHEAESRMNCLFALFGVVTSIADNNEDTDPLEETSDWLHVMEDEKNNYEYNKENIRMEREFWKNEVFRTSELRKGETAGGLIIFPFIKSASRLIISVKTEDVVFEYYFVQREQVI